MNVPRLPRAALLAGAGATVFAAVAWLGIGRGYFAARAELRDELAQTRDEAESWTRALDQRARLVASIDAYVDRTLGGDVESVDHRLRTRLNRIAEEIGLADVTVGTGSASARRSPARTAMSRRGVWRELRDEIDFAELEGWINARGSLKQAIRLAEVVAAEGWVKRIEQLRLQPRDNGKSFTIGLRLRTVFLEGREPDELPLGPAEDAALGAHAQLAKANPFRLGVGPPPRGARAKPPPPPGFPYGEWLVTGVAEGPEGPEIWVRNRTSGETRLVLLGGQVGEAALVEASGESARFRLGEAMFVVSVGKTLDERVPVGDEPGG